MQVPTSQELMRLTPRERDEWEVTVQDRWKLINAQNLQRAVEMMGSAATDPLLRSSEMMHFVKVRLTQSGLTIVDHLEEYGFRHYRRESLRKLIYQRNDGRPIRDILLSDKDGKEQEIDVAELDHEVFNYLYVKFKCKQAQSIEKARSNRFLSQLSRKREREEECVSE